MVVSHQVPSGNSAYWGITPALFHPKRKYNFSASPPVTVSRTRSVLPASLLTSSTCSMRRTPMPRDRAERRTSSLAISARCGWFGGIAVTICTVPANCESTNAANKIRSPLATSVMTFLKNDSASAFESDAIKPTDAPPSTQSSRTSASASRY